MGLRIGGYLDLWMGLVFSDALRITWGGRAWPVRGLWLTTVNGISGYLDFTDVESEKYAAPMELALVLETVFYKYFAPDGAKRRAG